MRLQATSISPCLNTESPPPRGHPQEQQEKSNFDAFFQLSYCGDGRSLSLAFSLRYISHHWFWFNLAWAATTKTRATTTRATQATEQTILIEFSQKHCSKYLFGAIEREGKGERGRARAFTQKQKKSLWFHVAGVSISFCTHFTPPHRLHTSLLKAITDIWKKLNTLLGNYVFKGWVAG